MMTPMSLDTYERHYWCTLKDTLDLLLTCRPGSFKAISYEQMYSAVYKCVCRQYSERLYSDVMGHLRSKVEQWNTRLSTLADAQFLNEFHLSLEQYFFALASIVPIFTYLNRFYVETKLHTDLNSELLKLFIDVLADGNIDRLMGLLAEAERRPFSVSPQVMTSLLQNLSNLSTAYINLNRDLFAKYLTGIRAPMSEEEIEAQIETEKRLQMELRRSGFGQGDQRAKRNFERDLEDGEGGGGPVT